VGAGAGAADLLTLRAIRLLARAEFVLHDALVEPTVLDNRGRTRRALRRQARSASPYCTTAGISFEVVPGNTAASTAAAELQASLTLRGVARAVTFPTPGVCDEHDDAAWPPTIDSLRADWQPVVCETVTSPRTVRTELRPPVVLPARSGAAAQA
jgi:uroporphyrin-III C-methyltransferase